jgi:serine/threonine protein kinase
MAQEARRAGTLIATATRGDDWSPPAPQLAGSAQHLTLLSRFGRGAGREVWAARSARHPGQLVIVEFLFLETAPSCPEAPGRCRFTLDLQGWGGAGGPTSAVVTVLPACLPGTYARFELLSFIGLGGMGQVWMAESPDYPDSALAIKFFTHPVYRQHPSLLEQCLQEAKAGININSSCIARTYQLLDLRDHQAEGWPPAGLVMPLYEPSLQRVIEDARTGAVRLPRPFVLGVARNLLDALDALHSQHGFVHRDVKPSNVLFRLPEGRHYRDLESLFDGATALLSDLGTLCRVGERPLFALGQDGWKAPELFQQPGGTIPSQERLAGPAEDLFALGKILQVLAGLIEPPGPPREETGTLDARTRDREASSDWLPQLAEELTAASPGRRQAARTALRSRLAFRDEAVASLASSAAPSDVPASLAARAVSSERVPWIEPYEIRAVIGHGGMGTVYEANDRQLNRVVALKVIRDAGSGRPDLLQRLRTEAIALASMSHPNIVQIYQIGETDGGLYLALEYCPGGNLRQRLRDGPLPSREAARLVQTLARAVHHANERGVLHRDLKPQNVLLADDHTPKIADFGLARMLNSADDRLTLSGDVMGTPSYMAPEQAAGGRGVTLATDVYGLGAILYELLTGRAPFRAATSHDTLRQVLQDDPAPPRLLNRGVDRDLQTICLKCLQKTPALRYPSASALADDLGRYLEGLPIHARPVGTVERIWRLCRRHPSMASLGLVLFLLPSVFLVWVFDSHRLRLASAEDQTRIARAVAHAERVATAREAARRGDWATALKHYQRALEDQAGDQEQLEEERLPGFLATNQVAMFLERLPGLNGASPALQLLRGELDLGNPERQEEARAMISNARAELPPADAAYAKALLAVSANEQLDCLNQALQSDPFHHRANRARLLLLVVRGDLREAHRQAQWFRQLFPDDPLADFTEALAARLEGDQEAMRAHLRHFRARVGPELGVRVEQFLSLLGTVLAGLQELDARDLSYPPVRWLQLAAQIAHLRTLAASLLRPLGMGGPTLGYLVDVLEAVIRPAGVLVGAGSPDLPGAVRDLRQAQLAHPEALLLALEASLHWELAVKKWNQWLVFKLGQQWQEVREECEALVDLAQRAATAPTLVPRSPLRYQVRMQAILADVVLLSDGSEPSVGQQQRLRDNLDSLISESRAWPALRRQQLDLVSRILMAGEAMPQAQSDRWHARKEWFHALARRLLNDWSLDDAGNPRPLLLLAELHLAGGNYQAALNAARHAASLAADREAAREANLLEEKARAGMLDPLKKMKE